MGFRAVHRRIAVASVAVVLGSGLAGCGGQQTSGRFVVGERTPEIRQPSLAGGEISLRDLRGNVVLVDFWATWCGPCHLQAEVLKTLHSEYAGRAVQFLAISVGEDEATVRDFMARKALPYPVLLDPEDRLSVRHEIMVLPSLLVVGGDGTTIAFIQGLADAPDLRALLDRALDGAAG